MIDSNKIVCPSCGTLIDAEHANCPNCFGPVGTSANLDPMGAIHGEGRALAKAAQQKPKGIVVFGVWLIFLPMLIISSKSVFDIISDGFGSGSSGFLFFWFGIGVMILSITFLYKVTRNYLRAD